MPMPMPMPTTRRIASGRVLLRDHLPHAGSPWLVRSPVFTVSRFFLLYALAPRAPPMQRAPASAPCCRFPLRDLFRAPIDTAGHRALRLISPTRSLSAISTCATSPHHPRSRSRALHARPILHSLSSSRRVTRLVTFSSPTRFHRARLHGTRFLHACVVTDERARSVVYGLVAVMSPRRVLS